MPIHPPFSLYIILSRHFSSATKRHKLPNLSQIRSRDRPKVIKEARRVLTEYLHGTRSLPFTYAEQISKNSFHCLYDVISEVNYSPNLFSKCLQRYLRYHPINEFEFFYESIGINYAELNRFLHPQKFFISEDSRVFDVACALSGFGFPWNSLGNLYREEISIFNKDSDELSRMLHGFKDYDFSTVPIVGICLVFPFVLCGETKLVGEIDALFGDLRKLFIDFDLANCVDDSIQAWVRVCRKIRIFYDLGCKKGEMGELMGKRKHIFLEYKEDDLLYKAKFFSRLGVDKSNVGRLLLESPEILDFDLESSVISVSGILNHFGLDQMELVSVAQKYPYIMGRNKMGNLPEVMRAINLHDWFFDQLRKGNYYGLCSYTIGSSDEDIDNDYKSFLDGIQSMRSAVYTLSKLNFLHGIGFGENNLTIEVFKYLHGTSKELRERFDCLVCAGVYFSKLCKMVRFSPKILNQTQETIENKLKFLHEDIKSSLEDFPAYLCFDLEKRIKPRYKFHMWLKERGLSAKRYSLASMLATSEKSFIARVNGIHPAAAKHWFECFSK